MPTDTAQQRYEALSTWREPFITRARAVAKLTIPTEVPREGHTVWETYPTPYQSAGSRGVSNLSSKLGMSLFPPNTPFFTLNIDPFLLKKVAGETGPRSKQVLTELNETLVQIESVVASEIDRSHMRPAIQRALRHTVIGGNSMLHVDKRLRTRMFPITRYVVDRDSMGEICEAVVFESVNPSSLTPEEVAAASVDPAMAQLISEGKPVPVYTWIRRERVVESTYMMSQSRWIGKALMEDQGEFRWDETPWIILAVNRADEESYGRGVAEEFFGDLKSLEGLTRAIVEAAVAAARVIWLVKPGSTVRLRSLATAPNGAFREGDVEDVGALRLDKNADLSFALQAAQGIEARLDEQFLVGKSVRRSGERVTAEEISFMIQDLEDTQVGVYSTLAGDLQLRLVKRIMAVKRDTRAIPELAQLPRRLLDVKVIAGLEGLGRGHELQRLRMGLSILQEIIGAEELSKTLQHSETASRVLTAAGVTLEGLLKTEEERQAEAQQAQAEELARQAAPNVARVAAEQAVAPQA